MRIVIFDLLLSSLTFHSTPRPTMEGLLISGYHKSCGDQVLLTDEPPNFALYDRIYIIKDAPELFHDPEWLTHDNVILVGRYWDGMGEWKEEWDTALPDRYLYEGWAENWMKRYPTVAKDRMESFFRRPVKLKQGKNIIIPEGNDLIIIDNDMHIWDKDGKVLKEVPMRNGWLLYPIKLDGRWKSGLDIFEARHLKRRNLWTEFDLNNSTDEDLHEAQMLLTERPPGRMFRIKMHFEARTNSEWLEVLPRAYQTLADFRNNCGKRLWAEPHYITAFDYPRILTELKRWSAMNAGYNKNSLLDYMLFDGCRNTEKLAEFLAEPYDYIKKKKHGKNKFIELVPFMEEYPELVEIISTSYKKAGY